MPGADPKGDKGKGKGKGKDKGKDKGKGKDPKAKPQGPPQAPHPKGGDIPVEECTRIFNLVKVRQDKEGKLLCISFSMHGKCDMGDACAFSHLAEKDGTTLTRKEKAALTQRKASMSRTRAPSKGADKGRGKSKDAKGKGKDKGKNKKGDDRPKCGNCGKPGHTAGECRGGPSAPNAAA